MRTEMKCVGSLYYYLTFQKYFLVVPLAGVMMALFLRQSKDVKYLLLISDVIYLFGFALVLLGQYCWVVQLLIYFDSIPKHN